MRSHLVPLIAAGLMVACAPRASRRAPQAPAPVAPVVVKAAPAAAPAPVAQAQPAPAPAAQPQPKATEEDEGYAFAPAPAPEPEAEPEAPEEEAPVAERTYDEFSDDEVKSLRRRSRSFRKLQARYRVCRKQAERMIARRDSIPEAIARLRIDGVSRRDERKIAKLRAEKARLAEKQKPAMARCDKLENSLASMLRQFHGGLASR